MKQIFEDAHRAEKLWASLPGYDRKTILTRLGHRELFSMTAMDMTIVNITIRFGDRLGSAIYQQMLGHPL